MWEKGGTLFYVLLYDNYNNMKNIVIKTREYTKMITCILDGVLRVL
jgi:hypothetical protein